MSELSENHYYQRNPVQIDYFAQANRQKQRSKAVLSQVRLSESYLVKSSLNTRMNTGLNDLQSTDDEAGMYRIEAEEQTIFV